MEIDDARLKKLIIQTFDTFKAFETELLAYEATFRSMNATLAEMGIATDLDLSLQAARTSPLIALTVSEKYEADQQRLLKAIDQHTLDEVFAELLQSWKPKGHPN